MLTPQGRAGAACLLVDDAQVMDAESLAALTFAVRRLRLDSVLVVLTVRDDQIDVLPASLLRLSEDGGDRIDLSGLSDADVAELAVRVLGTHLSARAASQLRRHTSGCPLHVRALLRELSPGQLESDVARLPAPRSFSRLVLHSLAATSPEAQRLAQAAAVLDPPVALQAVAQVAAVADLLPGIEELQRIGIVRATRTSASWEVAFEHDLVRAAVDDRIGPATMRTLHQRAAVALGPPRALDHLVAAASGPDEALAAQLELRARSAETDGKLRLAASSLLAAHRLTPPGSRETERLLDALDLLVRAGEIPTALRHAGAVGPLVDGHALRIKARLAMTSGDIETAHALALGAWEKAITEPARADVASMLAQMCIFEDNGLGAHDWAMRVLPAPSPSPSAAGSVRALAALGLAISGAPGRGLALLDDLPSNPRLVPLDRHDELRMRGTIRMMVDDLRGALADATVAATVQHDVAPFRIMALGCVTEAQFRLGDWEGSQATAEHLLSLVRDTEQEWLAAFAHAFAARVPAHREEWSAADGHVQAAKEAALRNGDNASLAYAADAAVHIAMCHREPRLVLEECSPLLRFREGSAAWQPGIFSWPVLWAEALVDSGQLDEAGHALARLEALRADVTVLSRDLAMARVTARLAAARGEPAKARQAFEQDVSARDDWPDALEAARAHADFGRFLRRRGERKAAIVHLAHARDLFEKLGAVTFLNPCQTELDAAGGPSREPSPARPPTLTPQEQTVARLVAAGMTNQEVSSELMLSLKTINFHLEHVYHKLAVHSRSQLAAVYRLDRE